MFFYDMLFAGQIPIDTNTFKIYFNNFYRQQDSKIIKEANEREVDDNVIQ